MGHGRGTCAALKRGVSAHAHLTELTGERFNSPLTLIEGLTQHSWELVFKTPEDPSLHSSGLESRRSGAR
eukprot:5306387-Pyramimonas_sp.AAC.1